MILISRYQMNVSMHYYLTGFFTCIDINIICLWRIFQIGLFFHFKNQFVHCFKLVFFGFKIIFIMPEGNNQNMTLALRIFIANYKSFAVAEQNIALVNAAKDTTHIFLFNITTIFNMLCKVFIINSIYITYIHNIIKNGGKP